MGAEEGNPKRGASEAKAPQGAVFFWLLFFCARKKKVTRREAKTCPEGKNMPGRMAHKDISQLKNPARRAKKPGPQAQREQPSFMGDGNSGG